MAISVAFLAFLFSLLHLFGLILVLVTCHRSTSDTRHTLSVVLFPSFFSPCSPRARVTPGNVGTYIHT
ncbi:hypothetical protein LZ32DRAFT_610394 [Colletotrichum eremochloae]|nr:hypothetical protein LZ32DRAFT_610394 [Colletotrichum eremochloae]